MKNMEQKEERVEAPVQEQVVVTKKPLYKKKGFWAAVITGVAILVGGGYAYMRSTGKGENSPEKTSGEVEETPRQQEQHRDREDRGNRDFRRHGDRNNNSDNR